MNEFEKKRTEWSRWCCFLNYLFKRFESNQSRQRYLKRERFDQM